MSYDSYAQYIPAILFVGLIAMAISSQIKRERLRLILYAGIFASIITPTILGSPDGGVLMPAIVGLILSIVGLVYFVISGSPTEFASVVLFMGFSILPLTIVWGLAYALLILVRKYNKTSQ